MLLPERMCRMDCLVDKEYKDCLVSKLHSKGVVEIEFLEDQFLTESSVARDKPLESISKVSDLLLRAKRAIDHLKPYSQMEVSFLEDMLEIDKSQQVSVKAMSFDELVQYSEGLLSPAEQSIAQLQSKIQAVDLRISELKSMVDKYSPYKGFALDSKYFADSPYLHTIIGLMPKESVVLFEESLSNKFGKMYVLEKFAEKNENNILVISVLKEDSEILEDIARKSQLNKLTIDVSGRFDGILILAESDLKKLSAERLELEKSFRKAGLEHYPKILAVAEVLEIEKQRCEVFIKCGSTENTTLMRLWTPQKNSEEVERLIEKETGGVCAVLKTTEFEDAPVLLNNPKWIKPFESLTRMFSLPKYNQIDPTMLLAPTFTLFFGMMFCDFVYGVLLILAAFMLYKKYGVYSKSIKDFSLILTYFGLSSMFFGLLTGSFFGDFVGKYVLGHESGSQAIALWLDPLYNGNMMVYIPLVFAIGFVHVFSGYFFGAFDAFRKKQYKTAFMDYVSLMLIPIGLAIYVTKNSSIGLAISAVSLLLVFIGSGKLGLYIKVSGMLGSVVSYARLLALMASSSGIAMTVNFMASMSMSIPYVGIVLGPLVFVGGHLINLALNMLGSFVHTLRLHYVEFFGTFYEGGGVEFTPFMESRKYSRLIERKVK